MRANKLGALTYINQTMLYPIVNFVPMSLQPSIITEHEQTVCVALLVPSGFVIEVT